MGRGTLVVRLRNVTDKAVAFDCSGGFFFENRPAVTDADGRPARLSKPPIRGGLWRLLHLSLAPEETVEFGSLDLVLAPKDAKDDMEKPALFVAPGTYRVRYEGLPPEPKKNLSTGAIDLEVKEAEDKGGLEGTWHAVSFEQDGRTPRDVDLGEVAATFEGDKYHFTSGLRVKGAGQGKLSVHPDADPKTFELTPEAGVFEGRPSAASTAWRATA